MRSVRIAVIVEWSKLRHSPVAWTTSALLAGLLPLLSAGFYAVAVGGGNGAMAVKAEALLSAPGWDGFLGLAAQIAAAAVLVGVGVVVSWVFAREHADGTFAALFALPIGRGAMAVGKLIVSGVWVLGLTTLVVAFTWIAGSVVVDAGPAPVAGLARLAVVVALTGVSGIGVAPVASVGRGYLPGVGATVLLIIAAQVAVLFGGGAWFPPAVPGLLAVGDLPGIPTVSALHVVSVPLLTAVLGVATVHWWRTAEVAPGDAG